MKWITKEGYQNALNKFNNKMYIAGKTGTLKDTHPIYEEYKEVLDNYKMTNTCKKFILILAVAAIAFIGYKFYTNTFGVEEVNSCSINNSCTYKNQD